MIRSGSGPNLALVCGVVLHRDLLDLTYEH